MSLSIVHKQGPVSSVQIVPVKFFWNFLDCSVIPFTISKVILKTASLSQFDKPFRYEKKSTISDFRQNSTTEVSLLRDFKSAKKNQRFFQKMHTKKI